MSNYIENLVMRTLSLAPAVQPRLPSLFEGSLPPRAPVANERVSQEASKESSLMPKGGHAELSDESQTFVRPADPRPSVEAEAPRATFVNELQSEPKANQQVQKMEDKRDDDAKLPISTRVLQPEILIEPARVKPALVSASPRSESKPSDSQGRHEEAPLGNDARRNLEPDIRKLVDQALSASAKPDRKQDRSEAAANVKTVSKPASDTQQNTIAVATKHSVGRMQPAFISPTVGPDIKVTIGRIDVRAVLTPPARATQREPSQSHSSTTLAQYLKERSEGRR